MILTLQVSGMPAIKLADYVCEDALPEPRDWFRIIKTGPTSTTYKCWADTGLEFDMELRHGTPSHLAMDKLAPSVKSPFSIDVKS